MLINAILMFVISALAVYISAENINAETDSGISYSIFAATCMVGIFLVAFSFIAGLFQYLAKSEMSSLVIKLVGLFDVVISGAFTGNIIYTFIKNPTMEGDKYTQVIFIVSGIAGFICFLYSVCSMIFDVMGSRFYNKKRAAMESQDITRYRVNEIYYSVVKVTGCIFAISAFLMIYYLAYQIKQFDINYEIAIQWQSVVLDILFKIGTLISVMLAIFSVAQLFFKKISELDTKKITIFSLIVTVSVLLFMLAGIIVLATLIGKDCFIDEDPILYIIFDYVLIVLSSVIFIGPIKEALLYLKRS